MNAEFQWIARRAKKAFLRDQRKEIEETTKWERLEIRDQRNISCRDCHNKGQTFAARRSNQSILKKISPEYSLEGLLLKLQYFGQLMWRADLLEKALMLGKMERKRRRGWQDETVGWHHRLNGREFEQTLEDGEGQGSLPATVHGVAKIKTRLRHWKTTNGCFALQWQSQNS